MARYTDTMGSGLTHQGGVSPSRMRAHRQTRVELIRNHHQGCETHQLVLIDQYSRPKQAVGRCVHIGDVFEGTAHEKRTGTQSEGERTLLGLSHNSRWIGIHRR